MKIFIGTSNPYKLREFSLTAPFYSRYFHVIPEASPIEEYGDSFLENALIKAKAYLSFLPDSEKKEENIIIAEDSGLVIPELNNLPGIYSARFANIELEDEDCYCYNIRNVFSQSASNTSRDDMDERNNYRVIQLLNKNGTPSLKAHYQCAMTALSTVDGHVIGNAISILRGEVINEKRGIEGFGYDPIFIPHNSNDKTFAEMDFYRKNLRSHRRLASQDLFHEVDKFYHRKNMKYDTKIVLEGNDGTGKSTIKKYLNMLGYHNVEDRGIITAMFAEGNSRISLTDHPSTIYIILDASPYTCQKRIVNRSVNNNPNVKYHTISDLQYWRDLYKNVACINANAKIVNVERPIQDIIKDIEKVIEDYNDNIGR